MIGRHRQHRHPEPGSAACGSWMKVMKEHGSPAACAAGEQNPYLSTAVGSAGGRSRGGPGELLIFLEFPALLIAACVYAIVSP